MSKAQHGNREAKKPKQAKKPAPPPALPSLQPAVNNGRPGKR